MPGGDFSRIRAVVGATQRKSREAWPGTIAGATILFGGLSPQEAALVEASRGPASNNSRSYRLLEGAAAIAGVLRGCASRDFRNTR